MILPNILKKMASERQSVRNPEEEINDNTELRNVMAFNRIRKPEKSKEK